LRGQPQVEVADMSLEFDATTKAALYATAGIADYWVVDLVSLAVIAFREPRSGGCSISPCIVSTC
jgi:Uma2 family endonuclease